MIQTPRRIVRKTNLGEGNTKTQAQSHLSLAQLASTNTQTKRNVILPAMTLGIEIEQQQEGMMRLPIHSTRIHYTCFGSSPITGKQVLDCSIDSAQSFRFFALAAWRAAKDEKKQLSKLSFLDNAE